MSRKLKERKVKSLIDIPGVFNKIHDVRSKSSIVFLENARENPEESNEDPANVLVSQKIEGGRIQDIFNRTEENKQKEKLQKKLEVPRMDIVKHLEISSKINPLDVSNFVNVSSKKKDSNNEYTTVFKKRLKSKKRALSLADVLLSMILITPLTVGFWRGTWILMDLHADKFPGTICFVLGILVHTTFAIVKNFLHECVIDASRKKNCTNNALFKITQILYTYVFGVVCNVQWRGGWIIFDRYFGGHIWITVSTMLIILVILASLRSVRNLIAVPSVVFVDKLVFVFYFPTRYKSNTRDWSLYLLDCAFSVGVVGTLVVFVWRGVWILFDLYLFPDDQKYSAIGSLAIGYAIVTVTFSLQSLMRYVCARLQGLARLIAADSFLLLSFLGTVNVWRGIWNVLDLWLVPDDPELSCWITHVGCFVFLVLLNCSNSILVRGVYIDAEEDDGKCVVFPCHYLRLFFKVEREKKEARRRNLLVASKDFRPRPDGNAKDTENGTLLPNSTVTTILPTNPESLV